MYATRIAADPVTVAAVSGFSPALDALAVGPCAGFLRAAWYGPAGLAGARTLEVRRGSDGTLLAAIPTLPFGPAIAGARRVPGPYWPFRGVPIAPGCDPLELALALEHPAAKSLGTAWRLGPARADAPATLRLIDAAWLAGWHVLARSAGTAWVIDCAAARAAGWPRPSTARRLARIERRLARRGTIAWQSVRGPAWSAQVLAELGAVEAASWIAAETDGSGAKFMRPEQRAQWQAALADPVLAAMFCATILRVDGRAVAFSFDIDDGPVRYGIAGSYECDFARFDVGKLVNHQAASDALAAGQQVLDMGMGDTGYKRAMGAQKGYALLDLLFVRNRAAARLMERLWGPPVEPSRTIGDRIELGRDD